MADTALPRAGVAASFARAPVVGVVRVSTGQEALQQARALSSGGLELIEITFSVPGATDVVRELLAERGGGGPPWIGMGTVSTAERARQALDAGAEFLISPNASAEVAEVARAAGIYLILGALTPTEIVAARRLGADLVKVYPLPPVGGAAYLEVIRQPLFDIPMLAAGGFGVEEIPQYRRAGASAFGIGAPLIGDSAEQTGERVRRAVELAQPEEGR